MANLNRQQQAAYLASDVLNFQHSYECVEGKYLTYKLEQVSATPYVVKIVNIGEKTNKDIISLTLSPDAVTIKNLIPSGEGDKLPDKYIHKSKGILITTHTQAASLVALPEFLNSAIGATNNNMISPKWLFLAVLLERLEVTHESIESKARVKKFKQSDIAWSFSECINLSKTNDLPKAVIQLFEAEFNKIPVEIRKPFETVTVKSTEVKDTKEINSAK